MTKDEALNLMNEVLQYQTGNGHRVVWFTDENVRQIIKAFGGEEATQGYRAGEWINIKDRMPDQGVRVLTLSKFGRVSDRKLAMYGLHDDIPIFEPDGMKPGSDITHWMPMPEPPNIPKRMCF